jgi:penicillin-binding protein 1A
MTDECNNTHPLQRYNIQNCRNLNTSSKKSYFRHSDKKESSGNKKQKPSKIRRRILRYGAILLITGIVLFSLFFLAVFFGLTGHVPTSAQLNKINNPQASEVFTEDGKLLGRYYIENRSNVTIDEISKNVIDALIATEDARFYEHRGIDEVALVRVLVKTILLMDKSSGGGSTLSQQIAKNLFPRNDVGILSLPVNKLREAIIAYRLERIHSKEEILTLYLNTVPFGENIFGIEVAAERFFSKKPADLTVDEAAVLIGMLKANNSYNPRMYPERSQQRRNVVISQMVANGYLTKEQGEFYSEKPLEISYRRISFNEGPAPYFLEMLKPELLRWCSNNTKENGKPWNLYTDGLRIVTTINASMQQYANQAVLEHMKVLQAEFDNHWADAEPWRSNGNILQRAIQRSDRYKKMTAAGKTKQEIDEAFHKKITTSLFTWDGLKEVETTPLDSIKHYLKLLNAGFLAMDPVSGDIKAWVGGIDFRFFKYDRVLSQRQVGSTIKPFIFLAALENELSPFEYYPAQQTVYEEFDNYAPSNFNGIHEGFYTMEGGLAQSVNTVTVDILMKTGIRNAIETLKEVGMGADLPAVPSIALGVNSESLRNLLYTYATLINNGIRVEPYYLKSISDSQNQLKEEFERPPFQKTRLNEINCQIITHMLETAIINGTGARIRSTYNIRGDFAGKTGTTQNYADGWFVGLTPKLVTGSWVGGEEPGIRFRSSSLGQGSHTALPIVGRFFRSLYNDPDFKNHQIARFPDLNDELLANLELPPYREMLELERNEFFFERWFAGKSKEEKLKEIQSPELVKEKKNVWQSVKGIFRKKK